VVVFIKDSRESNAAADSDDETAANARLQNVVGDITTSFNSARHHSQFVRSDTVRKKLNAAEIKRKQKSVSVVAFLKENAETKKF